MTYPKALAIIWPAAMATQAALLLGVWLHGCLGLHYWLRGESWWRRSSHVLTALAVLIPAAALAGVVVAGREVARLQDEASTALPCSQVTRERLGSQAQDATRATVALIILAGFSAYARARLVRRGARITVSYVPGPVVSTLPGPARPDSKSAGRAVSRTFQSAAARRAARPAVCERCWPRYSAPARRG